MNIQNKELRQKFNVRFLIPYTSHTPSLTSHTHLTHCSSHLSSHILLLISLIPYSSRTHFILIPYSSHPLLTLISHHLVPQQTILSLTHNQTHITELTHTSQHIHTQLRNANEKYAKLQTQFNNKREQGKHYGMKTTNMRWRVWDEKYGMKSTRLIWDKYDCLSFHFILVPYSSSILIQ